MFEAELAGHVAQGGMKDKESSILHGFQFVDKAGVEGVHAGVELTKPAFVVRSVEGVEAAKSFAGIGGHDAQIVCAHPGVWVDALGKSSWVVRLEERGDAV